MSYYQVVFKRFSDEGHKEEETVVHEQQIDPVNSILDIGLRHQKQIELLQKILDQILYLQAPEIQSDTTGCPRCGKELQRAGYTNSGFHSVFTDHKIKLRRLKCRNCSWRTVPSILSLFGTTQHPDLTKLQCETGATYSYRKSQDDLNRMCGGKRRVNNHDRIHHVTETVGQYISDHLDEQAVPSVPPARDLTIQIDGGHVKDKQPGNRSFEAMTSVVYQPQNIDYHANNDRGTATSKHCAASALDDKQSFMKRATLLAAKKQGLTNKTHVTAVCDGAVNCWQVAEALAPHCASMTRILDWFHLGMRFENIALPEEWKPKLVKIKWHLWRGNAEEALIRLDQLLDILPKEHLRPVKLLRNYVENNRAHIVNYEERQKQGLVFTSHLAESNVESLINQRCKGKQHMQWTRKGVHPLLQIRASMASNDWPKQALDSVLGAFAIAA